RLVRLAGEAFVLDLDGGDADALLRALTGDGLGGIAHGGNMVGTGIARWTGIDALHSRGRRPGRTAVAEVEVVPELGDERAGVDHVGLEGRRGQDGRAGH